jgi:PTH1 family peptidyl-tRNA hydrolase
MTYMNESGLAVRKLTRMFAFEPGRMLVIYDDIDLPLGSVRVRERGSAGTHKGMKSVIQHLGSQEFPRLRVGIRGEGPAADRAADDIIGYVLRSLRGKAWAALQDGVAKAADAAEALLQTDIHNTMNEFNRRKTPCFLAPEEAKTSTRRKND